MNYKAILENNGFEYSESEALWKRGHGFGMFDTVAHVMKGLFTVTSPSGIVFDDYITSPEEFTQVIEGI